MSLLEAIVLGIVQGLTEFLPISSTAHLRIVPAFAGWEDPGAAFTAVTQLGTLAAVLLYFRRELLGIARAWIGGLRDPVLRTSPESRLGWYILIGTLPILVFGFLFSHQIETGARSLRLIGTTMIVLGLVLLAAEKVGAITKAVRNNARRISTELGGVCCSPIAVRRNDSTTTIRMKAVTMTRIEGARLRTVSSARI